MNNLPPLSDERKLKIKEIIAEKLGLEVEEITDDSNIWDDLDMDMLDEIETIMELELEFGFSINDEDCADITTISDFNRAVNITFSKNESSELTDLMKQQSIGRTKRN